MTTEEQADLAAISAAIEEMYAMISGPAGPRDWTRQANAFHPEARQIRTTLDDQGRPAMNVMGLADYARDTAPYFASNPFYEVEIDRRIDLFGNMAHAWSVYEARTSPEAANVERRGINSIQLFKDPDRGWRIVSMIWDNEREGLKVPGVQSRLSDS